MEKSNRLNPTNLIGVALRVLTSKVVFQKSANLSCLLLTLLILELGTMDTSASSFVNYLSKLLTSSKLLELKLGLAGAGNSLRSIAS